MRSLSGAGAGIGCVVVVLMVGMARGATPSFTALGYLGNSYAFSEAHGVSGDGAVVVGQSYSLSYEAFRWTSAGGMMGLGDFPGGSTNSNAYGASGDGSAVVGEGSVPMDVPGATGTAGFRWTALGGMQSIGDLPGGTIYSTARAVSGNGSVVVGASNSAQGTEAVRWTQTGGLQGLGDFVGGPFASIAQGVSGNGSVIVGVGNTPAGNQAFRWTQATGLQGLGLLAGAVSSEAEAVSGDGSVIVGNSGADAFRWTQAGGMQSLGDLPGGTSYRVAYGVNGDGSVVVGSAGPDAFLWDPVNGMRRFQQMLNDFGLDTTGWQLTEARGVSVDGRTIAGIGLYNNNPTAWVATVPEPGAVLLLGICGIGMLRRRR